MNIVLVTGGNRGIGLEICRQLNRPGFIVILGSRDFHKGLETAKHLGSSVIVKQLDVTNDESIQNLCEFVRQEYGKLDILINNAGIGERQIEHSNVIAFAVKNLMETRLNKARKMMKGLVPLLRKTGIIQQNKGVADISLSGVKSIMETNFYGPWRIIQAFLPFLEKSENARIINMSSGMGQLDNLKGEFPAYSLSKSALNALTIMFSNQLKEKHITVNAMCPGWVKTDMGGPDAPRLVSEGADTAVWLATETKIPTGKFFRDRQEIKW